MQNTQQQTYSANYVINIVWIFMNDARRQMSTNDIFPLMLALLYSIHKGYPIQIIDDNRFEFPHNDDALLSDLVKHFPFDIRTHAHIRDLIHEFMGIGRDKFNKVYPEVLKGLFDLMSTNGGRNSSEFYTPAEITKLISYIVKSNGCYSIFDPFCGTASIVHDLAANGEPILFKGQELMERTSLYARLNLEAVCGYDYNIKTCDSFGCWNNEHFDAVVSCPPLGLRLTPRQICESEHINPEYPCRSVEDIMQIRSFHNNHANLTVTLLAHGFCFRGSHDYDLRRYLINNNLVDTIISLPTNILYGTSIPSVLFVCKRDRKPSEPIKFIHAEDYFLGDRRKRTFDYDRFIEMAEGDACDIVKVSLDKIRQYDYNLNPSLYYKKDFDLKEGQRVVRLDELICPVEGNRVPSSDVESSVSLGTFSKDFIEVLLNNGKSSAPSETRRWINFRSFEPSEDKYLLTFSGAGENRYAINTDGKGLVCRSDIKVYKVNEELVTPEYLAYTLINHKAISKGCMPLSGYMMLDIAIDSSETQKELVNKEIQHYNQKVDAEREADSLRLGVKQNVSDLEHMLGSTQLRINKIIARLEKATPSSENYQHLVKSMKDNVEYMNRIIQYNNARIDSESFNMKEGDLSEFIDSYADAWNNYGGGYFDLQIQNMIHDDVKTSFDKTLLTVMLDSILNNAIRHGFHKRKNHTEHNCVQISTSLVDYNGLTYVNISVANNGDPIAEGFTIEDYTSRGRYTASTGRSGLGGYHVYQIAKGHNGFMYLDSNKMWNTIVEVLLPVDATMSNDIPAYDKECI